MNSLLQAQPILSIASAGEELKLSVPTVAGALRSLAAGLLETNCLVGQAYTTRASHSPCGDVASPLL